MSEFLYRSQTAADREAAGKVSQRKGADVLQDNRAPGVQAKAGMSAENRSGLPPLLKAGIESLSGMSMDHVKVHYASGKPAQLNAHAYAQGNEIHLGPGQERHLPHEAWHVVQQAQGRVRPTVQAASAPINDDAGLEREADLMGDKATQMKTMDTGWSRAKPAAQASGVSAMPVQAVFVNNGTGQKVSHLASQPAVNPAPPSPLGGTIQRKLTKWEEIQSDGRGAIWAPHRTSIDGEGQSLGTGAAVDGRAEATAATITYTGVGDAQPQNQIAAGGRGVSVTGLGRQQPPGNMPGAWTTPGALKGLTKNAVDYKCQQLLPSKLGGSGEAQNYVALPPETAQKLTLLQQKVVALVHKHFTYLNYQVAVTESKDGGLSNVPYASALEISWKQINNAGAAVEASAGKSTLNIPSPSLLAGGTAQTQNTPQQNEAGNANSAHENVAAEKARGARVDFTTRIVFSAPDASGDGSQMEAFSLGPDHKIGDEPESGDKIWNQRTTKLKAAAGGKKTYVAGHLLNHHLGGPGNNQRNLVAIPADANDLHESKVESMIKKLVNSQHAWVYYKVQVTHAEDHATRYASALVCHWHQLDLHGDPIAGTAGATTIGIPAPSKYSVAAVATQNLPEHSQRHADAAKSTFSYDEVLLEDSATLGHQRHVMQPLVANLKALGLEPTFASNGALAADLKGLLAEIMPTEDESKLFQYISVTAEELKKHMDLKQILGLDPLLTRVLTLLPMIHSASSDRRSATASLANSFIRKHFNEKKSAQIYEVITLGLRNETMRMNTLLKYFDALVYRLTDIYAELKRHRKQLEAAAQGAAHWSGMPQAAAHASAEALASHTSIALKTGVERVVAASSAPMSPNQSLSVAEQETGDRFDNPAAARSAIAKARGNMDRPQPASSVPASKGYAAILIERICSHKQPWPKGGPGGVADAIAMTVSTLVAGWPQTEDAIRVTIPALYDAHTAAFNEYMAWLQKNLPK